MKDTQLIQKEMFQNLLEKIYVLGETEKDITATDVIRHLEVELRSILSHK
jgi:hypothetical protein